MRTLGSLPIAGCSDGEIRRLAQQHGLALRADELRTIADTLGRDPTVVEAHAFDAQWSEHCSYKSSRHHLKKLPTTGESVIIGPGEDSGVVALGEHNGERYGIVVAHESHNHPSQVVPFEGAATGIGGIVRDVLCMGAEIIAVADPLRFGRIDDTGSHQRYVAQSAVDGISAYGNAIGVPNIAGDLYFDERFDDNCLVNVVSLGLVKEPEIIHSHAPHDAAGWSIVLVGKATDPSGFGGASFSSVTLDAADEAANKGAVQVPDPFLKNVIIRASYRVFAYLRERGCTVGFKDLGAGGIMGCSAEICSAGGFGADIDLDRVNVAIPGLRPEVIAVGETQERLIWVLPPGVVDDVLRIYNDEFTLPLIAHNARAVVIGTVTEAKRYVLHHGGERVMDVDIDFLTGSIRDELPFVHKASTVTESGAQALGERAGDLMNVFVDVLSHRDVCSREPLYQRYDSVVRGRTVMPRSQGVAGVLAPIDDSVLAVALAVAGNPRYGKIDAHHAARHAVSFACAQVVAAGAAPVGLTDCLNFGNPRNTDHYSEFVAAVEGLAHAAHGLHLPFVSGNVSLYNESSSGTAVPASAIVSCIGTMRNVEGVITPGLKRAGSELFRIGTGGSHVGGTVVADLFGIDAALAPIDEGRERNDNAFLLAAIDRGLVRAARALGDGGLLAALAQMAFASPHFPNVGAVVTLASPVALFNEYGGYLVETDDARRLRDLAAEFEAGITSVGRTTPSPTIVLADGTEASLDHLYRSWRAPLVEVYG